MATSRPVSKARRPHQVPRVGIKFDPKTKITRDSFKAECDVHKIVEAYTQRGIMPRAPARDPLYDHHFEDGHVPQIDRFEHECLLAEVRSHEHDREMFPSEALRASESDDQEQDGTEVPSTEPARESGSPAPQDASDDES